MPLAHLQQPQRRCASSVRVRTIKGSPERSASDAWDEIDRMIRETLVPATGVDDDDVAGALIGLTGMGRTLVAAGILVDEPIVLAAPPLQVEIYVSLGNDALKGEERLGKVPGAATASEWKLYVPDAAPYGDQVAAAVSGPHALYAGAAPAAPAAPAPAAEAASAKSAVLVDADALRRITEGHRS